MCHKKITIFACNCVLRNHRLCPHSQNLVAVTPDNTMQGNSHSNPQDGMPVPDHINQPDHANTASEGDTNNDDANTVTASSQNSSAAPTITLKVSTPPPSPDGTTTPLNGGASPFAPTSSPFAPMSSPLAPTSSVGATTCSSTGIRSPLSVDTPSASIPRSPFGTIFTPIAPTSSLRLPFFGHSASASAGSNMNQNIIDGYPIPAPTNGTLTPSAWILTHLSYARQQDLNPNPQDLIKSTLAETRLPATRDPLPSGFYPRHFESAQRHIHWNDFKTEWIDCAAFFCTHFMDLPNMTAQEKEQEHSDCPEYFGDADMVVLQLGLCKECEGFHYEAASRGEGGSTTVEWGRAISMALGVGVGNGVGMGLGQGQTHGQNQSGQEMPLGGQHHGDGQTHSYTHTHNQQPEVGGQHATEDEDDGQTTPTVESRYSVVNGMLLRGRVRMDHTHRSHSQPEMHLGGQQQHDDDDLDNDYDDDDDEDGQTAPTVESRHSVVDGFLRYLLFG